MAELSRQTAKNLVTDVNRKPGWHVIWSGGCKKRQVVGNQAGSFKHPLIYPCTDYMHKDVIQVPEKGTYKWQLFTYWSDEFRQTHADHSAYIALNFAGALDACRSKLQNLVQRHKQAGSNATTRERHARAIARLQNTMTGAAMSYENCFRQH